MSDGRPCPKISNDAFDVSLLVSGMLRVAMIFCIDIFRNVYLTVNSSSYGMTLK